MKRGWKSKAQVTVFIIIAILVVGGIAAYFILSKGKGNTQTSLDVKSIKAYIDQCIKDSADESVYFIALQGGYYDKPVLSKYYLYNNIPYYWISRDKISNVPTIAVVEEEIGKYIDDNVVYCVNDFNIFKESGYEFEIGEIKSTVKLSDKDLQVDINYLVAITKEEKTTRYDKFDYSVNTKFKSAYDSADLIIQEQKKNPEYIPLTYIADLSIKKDFKFETVNLDDNTVLYTLIYNKDSDKPLIYAFINEYQWKTGGNQTEIVL
ncbi:MAG: hypothetical protein AABX54_03405 [Nanoarchaeota archaeon]